MNKKFCDICHEEIKENQEYFGVLKHTNNTYTEQPS